MKFFLALALVALASAGPQPFQMPLSPKMGQMKRGSDKGLESFNIVEGDMVLPKNKRNAINDPAHLWKDGVIPYYMDNNIGCWQDSWNCFVVEQGMKMYDQLTCIEFKERTTEPHWVHVEYNTDNACWSHVGYQPDYQQYMSLGDGCFWAGLIVHELGHVVGFYHEQNRPDRDQYIRVIPENIYPGYEDQFIVYDESEVNLLGENFDYKTVMLYEETAFSKDGVSPTIEVLQPGVVIGPVWERASLAIADVRRVHKLYNCTDTLEGPSRRVRKDETCDFSDDYKCGYKGEKWTHQEGGFVKTTEGGEMKSITYLSSLQHGTGCLSFDYQMQAGSALKVSAQKFHSTIDKESKFPKKMLWQSKEESATWKRQTMEVDTSKPFKLFFDASGEAALDNFSLKYSSC